MTIVIQYFEDIHKGDSFSSARRTVTEADILAFAGVSGDFHAPHVDDVYASQESLFGRRVAHGLLTVAIGNGLRSDLDDWDDVVYAGLSRRFVGAVFAGDTIHTNYAVTETRASSSRSDRGVVTVAVTIVNSQTGDTVAIGEDTYLVRRRAPSPLTSDSARNSSRGTE
jgi:3-hydroxybutyryl-CoA dehydratase